MIIIITIILFITIQGLCSEFDSVLAEIKSLIFLCRFSSVSRYFSAEKAKVHFLSSLQLTWVVLLECKLVILTCIQPKVCKPYLVGTTCFLLGERTVLKSVQKSRTEPILLLLMPVIKL